MAKPENVEQYIEKHPKWQKELKELRELLRSFALEETIKWGGPVYTYNRRNLIGLAAFKNHFALWFFHGSNLKKDTKLLNYAQEGKTQNLRQIKYVEGEIPDHELLKEYLEESINLAKQGMLTTKKDAKPVDIQKDFIVIFEEVADLELNFKNLSPGKQKEYILYITEAKREETKKKRVEKSIPLIMEGKGLNDKYKK